MVDSKVYRHGTVFIPRINFGNIVVPKWPQYSATVNLIWLSQMFKIEQGTKEIIDQY